jgi:hypothetical protein
MKLRVVLLIAFLLSFLSLTSAARQEQSKAESNVSIAGKVTLRGAPVPGALVLVQPVPPFGAGQVARGKTDANGQYRITDLPPGRYSVAATAPPLISLEERGRFGREITLDRGETRDNVDFTLERGGAITGRVSETNGQSIVEELVSIIALSTGLRPHNGGYQMMNTDDRGVYRIYGVPPGRYKVSVGTGSSYGRLNQGLTYYPQTYHPGVTEESKAGIVEVTEGGEVSGVDIVVGKRARTYEASGRLVDAETGRPQPGINWGYGGNAMSTFGQKSDEHGGFKITGLMPGRYSVFAGCEGDFYSEKVDFDVTDHDVTGLEIRRNRGASISGKVVVEGVVEPEVLSKLPQVSLSATSNVNSVGSSIDPDGSYYFCGLRPGRVKVSAGSWRHPGFWLLRVERDGVDLREGIEVNPGDHVTGVRVVLTYATGVIRGQVTLPGYELPQGVRLQISAIRLGPADEVKHLSAETDERGRFAIEGLISGEYELSAGSAYSSTSDVRLPRTVPIKQRVIVTNGSESTVNLVVKVIEKPKPQ